MIPGLTPLTSPHNLVVVLAVLFFRVNISVAILSWMVFSLLALVLDPVFHWLGLFLLTGIGPLHGFWTVLYNAPLIPYTGFNNTIVMGSLIVSLLAFYPIYLGCRFGVKKYRQTFFEQLKRWKIVQMVKGSSMYRWYSRYNELKG
jgi:uncharacterized protein (TIGR03546 family)